MTTKSMLAYIAAASAAVLARFGLMLHAHDTTVDDPLSVRVLVMAVFFVVLLAIDRSAFEGVGQRRANALDKADFAPQETPQQTSDAMARAFSDVTDESSRQDAIHDSLMGIVPITALIPMIFYVRFGSVGPLGWGLCVFFDVFCLLWALGLYFGPRTEYHTTVEARGDWLDRIAGFWLVGCAFGPFFGWILTEAWPITYNSWHWRYIARASVAACVPVLLALPMLRYVRGKSSVVMLPLLLGVTLLPVSTAVNTIRDLMDGPGSRPAHAGSDQYVQYLRHTGRVLKESRY